jgi:hypothetical protein
MERWARNALLAIALIGWAVTGLLAVLLVERVGWLGVAIIGGAVLSIAALVELDEERPVAGPTGSAFLMRQQIEQEHEGGFESRLSRIAARVARNRALYIVRTIGIAMALLGLNMFVLHQLRALPAS